MIKVGEVSEPMKVGAAGGAGGAGGVGGNGGAGVLLQADVTGNISFCQMFTSGPVGFNKSSALLECVSDPEVRLWEATRESWEANKRQLKWK